MDRNTAGLGRSVTDERSRPNRKLPYIRGKASTILILPHHARSNRAIAIAVLLAAISGGCAWVPTWTGPVSYARNAPEVTIDGKSREFDPEAACAEVIKAHNRLRAEAKLPPLEVSSKLRSAAEKHAKDMAEHGKMTHKGSNGSSSMKRILAAGYNYRRAGENVAAGYFTVEGLMKGWMDSPHHKRNILGSFSQIGVACATGENGKRYWCVTFGLPARR
jgi:hypothetical protein